MKLGLSLAFLVATFYTIAGFSGNAFAATAVVDLYKAGTEGRGESVGSVTITETPYGLVFHANLRNFPTGRHGFHIHANGDCSPGPDAKTGETIPAGAAGGHFDPAGTGKHSAPWDDDGHLGDLPSLHFDINGVSDEAVLAPKLKSIDQIRGRSLMVHAGGDNYADSPMPLGGGGARLACGLIR